MADALKSWIELRDNKVVVAHGSAAPVNSSQKVTLPAGSGESITIDFTVVVSDKKKANDIPIDWQTPDAQVTVFGKLLQLIKKNTSNLTYLDALAAVVPVAIAENHMQKILIPQFSQLIRTEVWKTAVTSAFTELVKEVVVKVGDSSALVATQIIKDWSKFKRVRLVVSNSTQLVQVAYLLDLFYEAGIPRSILQLILATDTVQVQIRTATFAIVVLDSGDICSAVQNIIENIPFAPRANWTLFVQQSIYETFVSRFKMQWSSLISIGGDPFDAKLDIACEVSLNTEAIDIESVLDNIQSPAVNILQFRTVSEALSLINHARTYDATSLWTGDVSLALELSNGIANCHYFWINSIMSTDASVPLYYTDSPLPRMNIKPTPALTSALEAQKKWSAHSQDERFVMLRKAAEASGQDATSLLTVYDNSTTTSVREVGKKFLVVENPKPSGVVAVVLETDGSVDLDLVFRALLSGNCVLLIVAGHLNKETVDFVRLANQNGLKDLILIVDKKLADTTESVALIVNDNNVGVQVPNKTSETSLRIKSKITWLPSGGSISFAQ